MNPETHYLRGMACFEAGQNNEALKHYNNALELDSEYAPAYRGKAEAYERKCDYGSAAENYEIYYGLVPDEMSTSKLGVLLYLNGHTLKFKGEYTGALDSFKRSAELYGYASSYHCMGEIHEYLGDFEAAMTNYDKSLEIDPRDSLSYSGKARIYWSTGAFIDAVEYFQKLSSLHPTNALPYYYLAIVFYEQGHYHSALPCIDAAILADEMDEEKFGFSEANPHRIRGLLYFERGDYGRAIADFDTAIAGGSLGDVYADRGNARYMVGEYDLAMADYNKAINSTSGSAYAYSGRATLYLSNGQYSMALSDLDMAIRLEPDDEYYRERRVAVYKLIGEETPSE